MVDQFEIHAVNFIPEGVAVQYNVFPRDVRVGGRVIVTTEIRLHASHPDYRDDIENLKRATERMVANALDDFESSEPFEPNDDDDDDDLGMGG